MRWLRFTLVISVLACSAQATAKDPLAATQTVPSETAETVLPPLEGEGSEATDTLRLNQIQVIGSHNSFKAAIDPDLFRMMVIVRPEAKELDYAHPPLPDQLNLGLRSLELDLFNDPEGGHYANPLGLLSMRGSGKQAQPYDPEGKMRLPGFKVMHVHDIDFRSSCLTLVDALTELRNWSERHPKHLPIVITFNLTDAPIELPGSKQPVRYDAAAYDKLDNQFIELLGRERLIVPDDIRGDADSLNAAVTTQGWPLLADSRGKFLLVLDDAGRKREEYLEDHPSLRGRSMFVNSEPQRPEAAVMIRNNPLRELDTITRLVKQGYLVRTRADAALHEARSGDLSRFEAAKKSGAQVISTDFYQADWRLNPSYRVRFEHHSCIRRNPVTLEP